MKINPLAIIILVFSGIIVFSYVWLGGVMGDRVIVDPIPEKIETAKLDLPEKTTFY